MASPQEQLYTIDDIYDLPEGERAELIDGQIYYMAPPSTKHQRISSFLHLNIAQYIQSHKGGCEIFPAPFPVYLDEKSNTYVEPDLTVICDKDKLDDKGCKGAPDWIIEIVSPGSRRMDYSVKLFKYWSTDLKEYWIVDPEKNQILVYDMVNEDTTAYTFQDSVKVCIYDDLSIDFSQLNL